MRRKVRGSYPCAGRRQAGNSRGGVKSKHRSASILTCRHGRLPFSPAFHFIPDRVEFRERERFEIQAPVSGQTFEFPKTSAEFVGGALQGHFGIDLELTRQVNRGKKQIPDLILDPR